MYEEQAFHQSRIPFIVLNGEIEIFKDLSHKEFLLNIKHYTNTETEDIIENNVRGYILKSERGSILSIYITNNFDVPKYINSCILELIPQYNVKQIHLGCYIGEPGDIWRPKKIIYLSYEYVALRLY